MKKRVLVCLVLLLIANFIFSAIHSNKNRIDPKRNDPSATTGKEIEADLSVDEAYKHMMFLVEEVGERLAGTKSIEKAAEYIKKELEKSGLDTRIDKFPMYHSYPVHASLRIVFPEDRIIEAKPICHIASTLKEGILGELIYVGAGGYEDYEGMEVKDKILLTDMTWSPPRPEKARIAFEKEAKALIIMNWGTSDNPVIQMGAVKSVWGNPTPESFKRIPQIPVISITRASGEYLKELCFKGKVKVWLHAEATREWVLSNQPVGLLKVEGNTKEFILVGSHLEAWGKTAICNSSGNALTLELARALAKHRRKLRRSIIFAFWDGHEIAEAAGSTHFVDTHWDILSKHCVAYVNIDNPGIVGTSVPNSRGTPEVREFQMEITKDFWGEEGEWNLAYKGGDESFLGVGVPYIGFATGYTPEELKRLNYASLSPWLHSEADTADKIDKKLFEKHLYYFSRLIFQLSNSEIVPYNLKNLAGVLKSHIESLKNLSEELEAIEWNSLIKKAEQLEECVRSFEKIKEKAMSHPAAEQKEAIGLINGISIKVSRELSPILWTEAGRYDQDPYGYYLIGKPIPRLYISIIQMTKLKEDKEEFYLWLTKFIRERNRASDAIDNSIVYLNLTMKLLDKLK